ncbi:MAG: hypothetical protein JSS96_04285 [Bacteroidetes bacterium]|nr:hypothetical protein [Bacteroidota bacterium]
MRHFLGLISIVILLFTSCASHYRSLHEIKSSKATALKYKPVFKREIYRCTVDGKFLFKKFHLSGILFFKQMDDGSARVIFQNEMGFTFFDFGWDKNDSVQVYDILPQLNKPAVVKLLEKDLNLFMMRGLNKQSETLYKNGNDTYYRFTLSKGYAYYIEENGALIRIENAGKHKAVTTITIGEKKAAHDMPGSILFTHHKAHFTIQLKKIEEHAD